MTILLGKNKEQYIANIMLRSNTLYGNLDEVKGVENFIRKQSFLGKSILHDLYVTRFNAVDLGDRYYSKVDDGHRVHDWHTKLWFALVKLGTVNCYARCISSIYQDWIDFRRNLGEELSNLSTIG